MCAAHTAPLASIPEAYDPCLPQRPWRAGRAQRRGRARKEGGRGYLIQSFAITPSARRAAHSWRDPATRRRSAPLAASAAAALCTAFLTSAVWACGQPSAREPRSESPSPAMMKRGHLDCNETMQNRERQPSKQSVCPAEFLVYRDCQIRV